MIEFIVTNKTELIAILGGIVTIASVAVKLTPTPKDDKIFNKVYKILEALSLAKKEK